MKHLHVCVPATAEQAAAVLSRPRLMLTPWTVITPSFSAEHFSNGIAITSCVRSPNGGGSIRLFLVVRVGGIGTAELLRNHDLCFHHNRYDLSISLGKSQSGITSINTEVQNALITFKVPRSMRGFCCKLVFLPFSPALPSPHDGARFIRWENKFITLSSANAYISTLGGGHFLCRQIRDAVQMALAQMYLCAALNDIKLFLRCHVHLVYCNIQIGNFRTAMAMLRTLRRQAVILEDGVLANMVESGLRYCRNTYRLYRNGTLPIQFNEAVSPSDEYYRQRLAALSEFGRRRRVKQR